MATAETWEEILRTNYTDLLHNIETNSGLFGELKKVKIFTAIALKSIWDCKDQTERIDSMLRNLQRKDFGSFKKFCDALVNSEQGHVVEKYLSIVQDVSIRQVTVTDCASSVDAPRNRAISGGMSECFKLHWNDLVLSINSDKEFLSLIERRGIFTRLQMNKLRDIKSEMKQTEQMLCWLERGSEKQFEDFRDALTSNNQHFIVTNYLSPKIRIPVRRPTESQIPESNPKPHPSAIQEGQMRSHDSRKEPEGRSAPLPFQVAAGNISFSSCSQEFLDDYRAKVLKKVAYKCESSPRGRAVIMNNMFFTVNHLTVRTGSEVDTENLQKLFQSLCFETVVYANKDAKEMWDFIVKESQESQHKDYDMFVLFLMSHGIKGEVYGIDGIPVKTADIVNQFKGNNCPALLAKPKLFFIQACQGNVKTVGVASPDSGSMTASDSPMPVQQQENQTMDQMLKKLSLDDDFGISNPLTPLSQVESDAVADDRVHEMADMAVIYATVDGYVAWRRVDTGSLFVQCLINVIINRAHDTDLLRMITEANNMLHELEMVENQGRYKQILDKRDTLRREVYLLPPL